MRNQRTFQKTVTWIAGVAAAIAFLAYYSNVSEQAKRSDCRTAYNAAFAQALDSRAPSAVDRQRALDAAFREFAIFMSKPEPTAADRDALRKVAVTYDAAAERANQARDASPYPSIPPCVNS